MVATHKMEDKISIALSGVPLISEPYGFLQFAQGLTFQEGDQPSFLVFNETIFSQLSKWGLVENGCLDLHKATPMNIILSLPQLKKRKIKAKPLEKIILRNFFSNQRLTVLEQNATKSLKALSFLQSTISASVSISIKRQQEYRRKSFGLSKAE